MKFKRERERERERERARERERERERMIVLSFYIDIELKVVLKVNWNEQSAWCYSEGHIIIEGLSGKDTIKTEH